MHTLWLVLATSLTFCLGITGSAFANNAGSAVDDAIVAAGNGRCGEAFDLLSDQPGLESRARLLAGQCRIRAGLYPEALNDLDRIRGAKDLTAIQVGDVELYRGVALYHLERYTEAAAALGRAEGLTTEEAQIALYRGLIALRNGDNDRAAPSLETAARLAPAITEPVASYYAGLAWQGRSDRAKARAAFRRVIEIDGDGAWGKEAAKMLEANARFPYYVNMSAGMEYDSNVLLRGGVTQDGVGVNTDSETDWRGVWRINGGVELFDVDDWTGGVTASYSGSAHLSLTDFDTHYPTLGVYVARRINEDTSAQVRYQYGFAWVDNKAFLQTQVAELRLDHTWATAGTTTVSTDLNWYDVRPKLGDVDDALICGSSGFGCGPDGLLEGDERDRDGIGYGIGLSHRYPVSIPRSMENALNGLDLIGGYHFRYFHSEGDEWRHYSYTANVGIEFDFAYAISLSTRVSYEFRDFTHPSTFPDREIANTPYALARTDRQEHEVTVTTEIEKAITDQLSVSARWSYVDNESNRRVYDYTRHIVGAYLNLRFD